MNVLIIALVICIAALGYLIGKYQKLKNNSIEALKRQYWEEISNGQKELVMTQKQVKEARTQLAAEASKIQDVQRQLSEGRRQRIDLQKEIRLQEEKIEFQTKNYERVIMAEKEASLSKMHADIERENSQLQVAYQKKSDELKHKYEEEETQHLQNLKNLEKVLRESADKTKEELNSEIEQIKAELEDYRQRRAAINEAVRREKELEEKELFYSIDIPQQDQEDIYVLQNMDLRLNNRDAIPRLVWDLYVRRPVQEMIKRVTGNQKISGIYKITYKKTGEAYIGKTTDFSTRWQNHLKTAIGLNGCARATLHNRLAKDGIWNYTFEILEEVPKENLSEREAYYIKLYGTKDQLNMKSGENNGTEQ